VQFNIGEPDVDIYAVIETVIFALFILLFRGFISSRSNMLSFAAVIIMATLLEIVNERFFSSQGTFYPSSLLYMPYFRFPVAIICLSAVYSFTIFLAAGFHALDLCNAGTGSEEGNGQEVEAVH